MVLDISEELYLWVRGTASPACD